jgi:hypothetical protein
MPLWLLAGLGLNFATLGWDEMREGLDTECLPIVPCISNKRFECTCHFFLLVISAVTGSSSLEEQLHCLFTWMEV